MEDNPKHRVEAVLFTTGRFLTIDEISKLAGIGSVGYLKQILGELKEEYGKKEGALEVVFENNRWKLNLRKEYIYLTEQLLSDAELDKPTQETLAIIAYRQPAIQADIIGIRGNKAYDHVRKLKEENFIVTEKFGRTRLLKLTPKFYDYFDVVEDKLKERLDGGNEISLEGLKTL
ncbi:MAG: SMC-Scp complex subunit ScpB [Candidatus Woesearchaeota archaeon]